MNRRNAIGVVQHSFYFLYDLLRLFLIIEFIQQNLTLENFTKGNSFIVALDLCLSLLQEFNRILIILQLWDYMRQYLHQRQWIYSSKT